MKTKQSILTLLLLLWSVSVSAANFSANIGWNSQYLFRGIFQADSSAFGGLDFEQSGFYLGTWAADVDDGLEIDYYGGYGASIGELSLAAGATWYTYTSDFDDTYREFNLSAGWKWFTLDVAIGGLPVLFIRCPIQWLLRPYWNFQGPR
jgi:uncharacterized protein (TIGR02001 family)